LYSIITNAPDSLSNARVSITQNIDKVYRYCNISTSVRVLSYLNTRQGTTAMRLMKDNRHFNNQIQKSINSSFEVIELNVDEPIMFQKRRRLFERKATNRDKNEKRKIMLVILR
jgi:hypothetical protein